MPDARGTIVWDVKDDGPDIPANFTGRINTYGRTGRQNHHYLLDSEKVDGVTDIIGRGVNKGDVLNRWTAKVVAEAAVSSRPYWTRLKTEEAVKYLKGAPYRHKSEAGAKGTEVHAWGDHYGVHGTLPELGDVDPIIRRQVEAMGNFLHDFQVEVLLNEVVVFNRVELYAGTTDLICNMTHPDLGRVTALLDYKSSRNCYPETGLQLAAYRYGDFYLAKDGTRIGLPGVQYTGVVHLPATSFDQYERGYALVPIQADRPVYRAFLDAKRMAFFLANNKKLMGTPLTSATPIRCTEETTSA